MSFFQMLRAVGRPIGYYPKLAKPLGGANAVILFSHFMYWEGKVDRELGIYKSAAEIEEETGLTVQEQRTARKKLRERGLLVETERRIEHRIYYKLNEKAAEALLSGYITDATTAKCNINSPEIQNQHSGSGKSTFDELQNQHSYKEQKTTSNLQQKFTAVSERERRRAPTRSPKPSSQAQQVTMLANHGVTEAHAVDWLEVRKSKRAGKLTKTAMEGLLREADKAGISVDDAVRICAERGWQGFNASWNWRDDTPSRSDGATSVSGEEAQRKAYAQEVTEQILRRRRTIEGGSHD